MSISQRLFGLAGRCCCAVRWRSFLQASQPERMFVVTCLQCTGGVDRLCLVLQIQRFHTAISARNRVYFAGTNLTAFAVGAAQQPTPRPHPKPHPPPSPEADATGALTDAALSVPRLAVLGAGDAVIAAGECSCTKQQLVWLG